jgi:Zn-dependent protease with chaperone function
MKHPVALAFLVAVVTTLALAGLALAVYTPQQAPWALAMAVGTFPFVWFFAWLITNGISWWRETTAESQSEPTNERPEAK